MRSLSRLLKGWLGNGEQRMITGQRFWEIDFLRGLAIMLMLGFHFLDDLIFFKGYPVAINPLIWNLWQKVTAVTFLLVAGISLALTRGKFTTSEFQSQLLRKLLRRGGAVFGWGILITIVTKIFLDEGYIRFGVLHLIGFSIMVGYPFLRLRFWNGLLGIMVIGIGIYLNKRQFPFTWLLWAGFTPKAYYTVDYFPVLPWFGVILLGIFLGQVFYQGAQRRFPMSDLSGRKIVKGFCFLGKHSLPIYLVHQPLFVAVVYLIKMGMGK